MGHWWRSTLGKGLERNELSKESLGAGLEALLRHNCLQARPALGQQQSVMSGFNLRRPSSALDFHPASPTLWKPFSAAAVSSPSNRSTLCDGPHW